MEETKTNKDLSVIQKMVGVFFSPKNTFEAIDRKPDWIVPLLLILILTALTTQLLTPKLLPKQLEIMEEKWQEQGLSDDQIEQALAMTQKFSKFSFFSGIIFTGLFIILFTLFLWFFGNIILGGQTSFKKIFSIYLYSYLILLLGGLITLPLMIVKETQNIHFSLASLFYQESSGDLLYKILRSLDLFSIWHFAILTIAFSVIYRFTLKKTAWAMIFPFIIYSLIMALFYGMQQV